jgi:hypothetical protein
MPTKAAINGKSLSLAEKKRENVMGGHPVD